MTSSYVTFGEFNKPQEPPRPPPPPTSEAYNHIQPYSQEGYSQNPSPTARYPIRQHMTQPRNPYNPQMLPPYPRTEMPASRYYNSPSESFMMPQPPPPPLTMPYAPGHMTAMSSPHSASIEYDMPSNSTPIGKALSEDFDFSSSTTNHSEGMSMAPPRTPRLMDATCVDINDHIVNCPICSKYYQNHTTVYVGIIILLGFIILIFLLKSIMEVRR